MDLKPGVKCFAKMKGYCPWPARVDVLPTDVKLPRGRYPVFFYGTHEVSYIAAKDIYDFEKFRDKYGSLKGKNTKFKDAMMEIDNNPTIYQLGHDKNAIDFLAQFYKFDTEILKSEKIEEKCKLTKPISVSVFKRKRQHCDSGSKDINEPKCKIMKRDKIDKSSATNIFNEKKFKSEIHTESTKEKSPYSDKNSFPHQIEKSIQVQSEQNLSQLVLQPKNETIPSTKRSNLQCDIVLDKPPIQQSLFTPTEVNPGKIQIPNILINENREISIVLKDVLTCTEIPSVRNLPELENVNFRETENNNFLDNSEISHNISSENVKNLTNSFKSPIKTLINERPQRASAQKFKQNFLYYIKNMSSFPKFTHKKVESQVRNKKEINKSKKSDRKSALTEEKNRTKIERSSDNDFKQSIETNRISPSSPNVICNTVINKEENNLRIVSKLSIIDKEIKKSLIVGQENFNACLKMLNSLLEMTELSLVLLCQVSEIIVTIRKCRRYKKSDTIKSNACKIFEIFSKIYENADLDEKVLAGTELLKRDVSGCKSAQTLFNELFIIEKRQSIKHNVPSLALSSPSSAQSFHSSANNTPILMNETSTDTLDNALTLDPDVTDINELIKNGVLVMVGSYSYDESEEKMKSKSADVRSLFEDIELYKQLGV